jgi:hypothetical protein
MKNILAVPCNIRAVATIPLAFSYSLFNNGDSSIIVFKWFILW